MAVQVKVMRLDCEHRTGTKLTAAMMVAWFLSHAGWVDAKFRVEANGATP